MAPGGALIQSADGTCGRRRRRLPFSIDLMGHYKCKITALEFMMR
jgi:hypothetical protein